MVNPTTDTFPKLPVLKLIAAAFILPLQQADRYVPAFIIPALMFIAVQGWVYTQPDLQLVISNPYAAINMGMGIVLKLLGINLLLLMFTAMIGLNVMQLVLKPDAGETRLRPPAIGPLERRFMWKYIQLLLSFVVLSFTLILIASIVILPFTGIELDPAQPAPWEYYAIMFVAGILPAIYFIARLSLILPATALEEKSLFDRAWQLAEGNGIRLLIVVGAVLLISTLLVRLLPVPDSFILFLLIQIVGVLFQVVLFIAVALSYQWLRQQEELYYNSTDNNA